MHFQTQLLRGCVAIAHKFPRRSAALFPTLLAGMGLTLLFQIQAFSASPAWPLKVSGNGRYLVDQRDQPFFYTADTSWTMLSMLRVEDAKKYIDIRKSQGFNAIQTVAVGFRRSGKGPRGAFFEGGDVTKPNEAYFAGVDEILSYAQSQDMLLSVGVLWLADNGGWAGGTKVAPEQFATYAKWLGTRYQNRGNLVWFLGGDEEISIMTETTQAGAKALRAADRNHLISYHPRSKAFGLRTESWLGYHSFQWNANSPPYAYQDVREAFELTPTKPVLDAEPAYDPDPCCGIDPATTPQKVRRDGWWAALSGAMGVVYGGPQGTWNIGAGGKVDWGDLTRPAATHTGNIRKILEPLAWNKLVPDFNHTVIKGGGTNGSPEYVAVSVASDGSLMVAYTPIAATLQVDLSKLSGPGIAQWIDPASGKAQGTAEAIANAGSKIFTTPGTNSDGEKDWVLIVRKEEVK